MLRLMSVGRILVYDRITHEDSLLLFLLVLRVLRVERIPSIFTRKDHLLLLALGFRSKGGQVPQGRKEESVVARAERAQLKKPPFSTETPQGVGDPLGIPRTKT